jgi:hypothetical protein
LASGFLQAIEPYFGELPPSPEFSSYGTVPSQDKLSADHQPLGFSIREASPDETLYGPLPPSDFSSMMKVPKQLPAPYLIPIQPLGMVLPGISDMQLPDPIDANFGDFELPIGTVDPPPEYSAPTAGDFISNLGGSTSIAGYQIPPSGMPSGFSQGPGSLSSVYGLGDTLLDGLGLSASVSGTYDSNPSQGNSTTSSGTGGGDFYGTLGGTVAYRSKAPDWTYGVRYTGAYNNYLDQTDLNSYNQNAGASVNYEGGPLTAELNVGVDYGSGANRYFDGAVVNQITCNYGLLGRYRISPKTSLAANISQNLTSTSGGSSSNTESFTTGISALWRYSPLTEFGPGISYSVNSGSNQQSLTSIAPTLTVNYKLSSKVSLNSLVGLEFSEYEDGQTADPTMSANIGLNYRASALWGMNLSFFRNVRADPGIAGQFQEITSLRLGYTRKIRRAQLNLGASIENNVSQGPDSATTLRPDSTYLNFDSSVSMPIFSNSCNANLFFGYSDQEGGSALQSWDSFRIGLSLSRSF